jgi:hypothetical protein
MTWGRVNEQMFAFVYEPASRLQSVDDDLLQGLSALMGSSNWPMFFTDPNRVVRIAK